MLKYILSIVLAFTISACSSDEQGSTSSDSVKTKSGEPALMSSHKPANFKLIFFLDPNGGPCRMQAEILDEMAGELNKKVDIQYVQTTVPVDRDLFYQYGIRALPTLLLADSAGKEIKRIPPGVKNASDIRTLIQSIPRS